MKQLFKIKPILNAKLILVVSLSFLLSVNTMAGKKYRFYDATQNEFVYSGRTERLNDTVQALISSAAHTYFKAKGDSITFLLSCQGDTSAYVVVELNGKYFGRYKVLKSHVNNITIPIEKNKTNLVGLFKATEASNGAVLFYGAKANKICRAKVKNAAIIEFIGNSITCGFGADTYETPCGTGTWYDQHNAYLAYGPLSARQLNADYRLSSVSGMGIYRNWNDEDTKPVMGDVYFTTRLNGDKNLMWDFSGKKPDVVSICLGTNDLSDGDGKAERKPFNPEKYIANYIDLVKRLFEVYPNAKLALLTSPMVSENNNDLLLSCLKKVKAHFDNQHSVTIFVFKPMRPQGCGSHPNLLDHEAMAEQLVPFYRELFKK